MKRFVQYFFASLCLFGLSSGAALATNLGDITETLETPVVFITKLLLFSCYVIGAILIFAALAQYKNHRDSPKLVPLTTPVMLLALGIVLLLVPYFTTIDKGSASAVQQQKREGKGQAPDSTLRGPTSNGSEGLGPGNLPPDEPVEPYESDGGSSSGGGGHWSQDY